MLNNKYDFLDTSVLTFVNKTITNYPGFSEERFQLWIESNEIESKNNPSAFVNKCFLKELNKGTFTTPQLSEVIYVPETVPMFMYMRELGIKVTPVSTGDIDTAYAYILKHKVLTPEELAEMNRDIIRYLEENKEKTTSDEFVKLMKKSKLLTEKVDWKEIDKEIKHTRKEWESLMKQFDALEAKRN